MTAWAFIESFLVIYMKFERFDDWEYGSWMISSLGLD
jgi:hypothetical protein